MIVRTSPLSRLGAVALMSVVLPCAAAAADTVNIPTTRDNILIQSAIGEWSAGLSSGIVAGQTNQPTGERLRRAVMFFDVIGSVPLGSTVTTASVRLKMVKSVIAGTNTFTLHRTTANWGEGTSGGAGGAGSATTPGSATWIHRFSPNVFWSVAGGDHAATPSASLSVGGLGTYTWNSAQLASDVQAWLGNPNGNYGWTLRGNEAVGVSPTAKRFDSEEAEAVGDRPTLIVNFTPPPVIGACCLGLRCVRGSSAACAALGGVYKGDSTACEASTCATTCPGDIVPNNATDTDDLLAMLGAWGYCSPLCLADIAPNGVVDTDDLLTLLGDWGPCR